MSPDALYRNVVALDTQQHRALRVGHAFDDWSPTAAMNACVITVSEFAEAGREYPIVFVPAGTDEAGEALYAPVAVFGLALGENLYLTQPGGGWRAGYRPAYLRRYPFAMAPAGEGRVVVCIDDAWDGWSRTEGQALFDDAGKPSTYLDQVRKFLEGFEVEVHRTRQFCTELRKAGLLSPMRFDAKLPDGSTLAADGFFAVDEKKLTELPEAKVVELHRNGILAMIAVQQASMGLMRRLVEWRLAARVAA